MALFQSRGHYENFPVASVLLPRHMRRHVAAVYAFARTADDFADEGTRPAGERLRLLDGWRRRLHATVENGRPGGPPQAGEPQDAEELFGALGATIREHAIPVELFDDLLSAFTQDVTVARYHTWAEVVDYCRRSANPVGRIVLRIAGRRDAQLDAWSDEICTALQLTNFWQDLRIDFDRGRVYVPAEEMHAHAAREADLANGLTEAWRHVLASVVHRTRAAFDRGRPLCDALAGRLRQEVRATWLGGMRILDRLESSGYDVLRRRPVLRPADVPWFAWRLLVWPIVGPGTPRRMDMAARS